MPAPKTGSAPRRPALLLTCEHAGNQVPTAYRSLFASPAAREALKTHRGFDIGALALARALSRRLCAPLLSTSVSRLLVDANRSSHRPELWSEFSTCLTSAERDRVLAQHYQPHRQAVFDAVRKLVDDGEPVLHLGVHSFTPVLNGEVRKADIGLLYDPQRPRERALALRLQETLKAHAPALRTRRNYPYRGASDGLTTALRRTWPDRIYAGIELELNQALLLSPDRSEATAAVVHALTRTLSNEGS